MRPNDVNEMSPEALRTLRALEAAYAPDPKVTLSLMLRTLIGAANEHEVEMVERACVNSAEVRREWMGAFAMVREFEQTPLAELRAEALSGSPRSHIAAAYLEEWGSQASADAPSDPWKRIRSLWDAGISLAVEGLARANGAEPAAVLRSAAPAQGSEIATGIAADEHGQPTLWAYVSDASAEGDELFWTVRWMNALIRIGSGRISSGRARVAPAQDLESSQETQGGEWVFRVGDWPEGSAWPESWVRVHGVRRGMALLANRPFVKDGRLTLDIARSPLNPLTDRDLEVKVWFSPSAPVWQLLGTARLAMGPNGQASLEIDLGDWPDGELSGTLRVECR